MRELNIKETQNRLLQMAKEICNILERNSIPYFIIFGTLLGAVRHKGFIPWDDDFDIMMFDDTYEKGMEALRRELPKDLFLEDSKSEPLFFHAWAHVKDLNTIAYCVKFPQDNIYEHKGISIDLYKAVYMKECEIDLFRLKEYLRYVEKKEKVGAISKNEAEKTCSRIKNEIAHYSCNIDENKKAYGLCMEERVIYENEIFPLIKYRFENVEFYGPNNSCSLLERFYGDDYLSYPSIEERVCHYSKVEIIDS